MTFASLHHRALQRARSHFSCWLLLWTGCWSVSCSVAHGQSTPTPSFQEPRDTQPLTTELLSPAAALQAIRLPEGFRATLFAAEPQVRQPIALATDRRGRLWVAENYTYAQREVNFDPQLRDRIVILSDTNSDGQADQRTVFWDQARKLTSIELGLGGVWALCPPQLLFLPDRNGDDRLDGPPEVVLDGWDDDAVRHNIANGLRWGPDGWLYGRHGILATSQVGLPGTPPEARQRINCGIWRYHPLRRQFEVVCHGTTNSWGMDWDEHGQLFFINTVIGHLWHVLPGAHFARMYGEDLRPHLYELIPQTADHVHWDTAEVWSDIRTKGVTPTTDKAGGGHAHCGMVIYQEGVWPRRFHNTVLTINLHGRRLNNDLLTRRGAGYVGTHAPDLLHTTDPWFRGVELVANSTGGLFLADWSDIGECHENDGVHRSSGRIFQISYVGDTAGNSPAQSGAAAPLEPLNLETATDSYLAAAQFQRSDWLARQSRSVLRDRAIHGREMGRIHEELRRRFDAEASTVYQLRALWTLYQTGGVKTAWLVELLNHPAEQVRAWAVQLLCDTESQAPAVRDRLAQPEQHESSGLVLSYLASVLQRIPVADRWPLARQLGQHGELAADPVFPLLVWYGIEPAVVAHPEEAVPFVRESLLPRTRMFVARRLTTEITRLPAEMAALVHTIGSTTQPEIRLDLLRGMATALRGWRKAPAPAGWEDATRKLASGDGEVAQLVRELAVVFGDGRALDAVREIAASPQAELESRRAAIRTLTAARAEGISPLLRKLMSERDLQIDAIRGLAAVQDPQTAEFLLERYRALYAPAQREALGALVARPASARLLLAAIAANRVPREHVSAFQVRQMLTLGDAELSQQVQSSWPELQQRPAEKSRQIAQYRELLTPERLAAANLPQGRLLFQRSCANCHILFGQGTLVGPDLTGAQRSNLQYLLENIVDPSATVAENFRMSIVAVNDGRILNGVIVQRTPQTVTLATPTERLTLAAEDIEDIRASQLSIMPEGQIDVLDPEQVGNLIAYLMSPTQVALPPEVSNKSP